MPTQPNHSGFDGVLAPLEFTDLPLDRAHPVAWAINRYANPTGRSFDIHAGLEIGVVLKGRSRRFCRQHQFDAEPGDLWLIAPWEPHGVQILRKQTLHLVLGLAPEFLGIPDKCAGCDWMQLFRLPPPHRPQPASPRERRDVLAFGEKMISVLRSDDPFRLARLRLTLQEFLLFLMERSRPTPHMNHEPTAVESDNVLTALRLVEKNPGRKITLADGARAAGMSRTRFAEEFRSFTGLTFARYLTRRRVRGVIGELDATDEKLQALAQRWGFADASHLVRIFRLHAGCTPQAYRRLHNGAKDNPPTPERIGAMPRPRVFV